MAVTMAPSAPTAGTTFSPKILVFSTNNISDPGIDLAGSSHLHYSPRTMTLAVPCSSGIAPEWIAHAFDQGIDGVFIASDGEECSYLTDCSERSARVFERAQALMAERGYAPERLKMAAICSVCAEAFVKYMHEFEDQLLELGPARVA
jgi:F420-non-reducing hydrogenase iron-sulfur subunit